MTDTLPYVIRRAAVSDAEAAARIYSGSIAIANTFQIPYPSTLVWERKLAETPEGTHHLAAVAASEVVGMISLITYPNIARRKHVGTIGMGVRDDWQGKGVGTALMAAVIDLSDNWLNLTRLELEVYDTNEPARRLYERFGFEVEGRLRQYAFRAGEYVDAIAMGRLRPVVRG